LRRLEFELLADAIFGLAATVVAVFIEGAGAQ